VKVQPEKDIKKLFETFTGRKPEMVNPIAASGSARKYFRIFDGQDTYIGAYNPDHKENDAFISFTRHFHGQGLPVPELLATEKEKGIYLLSDLGNTPLFDLVMAREDIASIPDEVYSLLSKTVRMLPHFQVEGGRDLDYSVCYPRDVFDQQSMLWDLNYFKYYILKTSGITFNEQLLEKDFLHFADFLSQAGHEHFMYRDFQSRNVMIKDGMPFFIDYQGGRNGPLQYDLASFLYQVKARMPEDVRNQLIDEYLHELGKLHPVDRDAFMKYYYPFVYLRLFQVLGAYGFRGLFEKRPHFTESLEPAMATLARLLNAHPLEPELTELKNTLRKLTQSSKYLPVHKQESKLTVSIHSFSYKKGIPDDPSGNGGGYVFDCRALPNPGRLEKYRDKTGRDNAVINYLSRYREVDKFLYNVFEICDAAVENYIERDFENLSISFGCTGGQHRSVYCADKLAEHLAGKYVISIKLHHREQDILESRKGTHE
jgi:aminoglycoside/choline kinase family phosphotransferase